MWVRDNDTGRTQNVSEGQKTGFQCLDTAIGKLLKRGSDIRHVQLSEIQDVCPTSNLLLDYGSS
jgi:hypothetical protein